MWFLKYATPLLLFVTRIATIDLSEEFVNLKIDISTNSTDPLLFNCGEKQYYIGLSLQANYFKASEFCRLHSMHLATIDNKEQDLCLENKIIETGHTKASYWIGANDLGQEGNFMWQSTGFPIKYSNWHLNNPDNRCNDTTCHFSCENCVALWYVHGLGRKWNDCLCTDDKLYFICEKLKHF